MTAPTYDLTLPSSEARTYLDDVSALVREMLLLGESRRWITAAYCDFVTRNNIRANVSHEEALLEVVTLGVLWRARGSEATRQTQHQQNLVTEIVRERRTGSGKRRDGSQNELLSLDGTRSEIADMPTLADLDNVSDWLYATGEYDDELHHLDAWLRFLATEPASYQSRLRSILSLTENFEVLAPFHLGIYTKHVDDFLDQQLPRYRTREDAAQCSRRRIEYHLNMFGAELLNRLWREEFLATERQVVVVPGCLRSRSNADCRAIRSETELRCTHCTRGCIVSQVTRIAARYGRSTVAVLHGSDFSKFLRAALALGDNTGVVGVACAPGILGAGYRAKNTGLPAQCVLLNASGCAHWRTNDAPAGLDLGELARILKGEERGAPERESSRPKPIRAEQQTMLA